MDWIILLFVRTLEIMFVAGAIGSVVVLVLSAISETKGAMAEGEEDEVDATSGQS